VPAQTFLRPRLRLFAAKNAFALPTLKSQISNLKSFGPRPKSKPGLEYPGLGRACDGFADDEAVRTRDSGGVAVVDVT